MGHGERLLGFSPHAQQCCEDLGARDQSLIPKGRCCLACFIDDDDCARRIADAFERFGKNELVFDPHRVTLWQQRDGPAEQSHRRGGVATVKPTVP